MYVFIFISMDILEQTDEIIMITSRSVFIWSVNYIM